MALLQDAKLLVGHVIAHQFCASLHAVWCKSVALLYKAHRERELHLIGINRSHISVTRYCGIGGYLKLKCRLVFVTICARLGFA